MTSMGFEIEPKENGLIRDGVLCTIALIILSPIFIVIAFVLKSTGPVFYSQQRVGKDGKIFNIIKFRTMIPNAENETGPVLSYKGDARVTKIGSFLRKTHLDELPQLINVLCGDMSLIGPRPERPEFTQKYNRIITGYEYRQSVRPGITGLAQIKLPYDATASEKIKYDLYYIKHKQSIMLNLSIATSTIFKMFRWQKMQRKLLTSFAIHKDEFGMLTKT